MCGYLSTKYVCVSLLSTNVHILIVVMWINGLISSVVAIAKTILNHNDIQHISTLDIFHGLMHGQTLKLLL